MKNILHKIIRLLFFAMSGKSLSCILYKTTCDQKKIVHVDLYKKRRLKKNKISMHICACCCKMVGDIVNESVIIG